MSFEWWIGLRYAGITRLRKGKRRSDRFVSFIAASSMTGIALGVAALIIVLSVMNGFQTQVRDRMLSVLPHIELNVPSANHTSVLNQWDSIAQIALNDNAVIGAAPYVSAQAMLAHGRSLNGVQVRGIEPEFEDAVSDIAGQMQYGSVDSLADGSYNIVIGSQLAGIMSLSPGDTVLMLAPQGSVSPAGFTPRMRQFTISGIFSTGYYEYDASLVFINAQDAARVFRNTGNSGVRLRINDMQNAPFVARQLLSEMPRGVQAMDWTQSNRTWFAAVKTEKRMMFIILTLIVAVAAFNLLSSLVMAVKDKQSDVAILRTLGATPRQIAKIFLVQGSIIGFIGTVLGVLFGTLIAYNVDVIVPFIEGIFSVQFLPQQIYFISEMPSNPQISDIAVIGCTSLLLSLLATLYPSWRASRLQPAQVLRYD